MWRKQDVLVRALVWSISLALVSGRVGGTLPMSPHGVLHPTSELHNASMSASALPSPPFIDHAPGSGSPMWVNVLGLVTACLLVVAILGLVIVMRRFHRRDLEPSNPWKAGTSGLLQRPFETAAPLLSRWELESACEDFSNIIGSSPDGVVYKGTLSNGTEVAVTSIRMCAADWSPNSEQSFRRKVEGLARMKHKHLVNLVAYCTEEEPFTRMLVFEYASNGTLSDHLHNPNKESEHLDWQTRMRIIMGATYGLEYMHHDLTPPCSHLSFDSNAIYLTDDYAAKVANFGIARMAAVDRDDLKLSPSWSGGSRAIAAGYSDEWEGNDRHCPGFESNLYNFGVFLLETISGRAPYCEPDGSLVDWASEYLYDPKMVWYLVDPVLKSHNIDELSALCTIVNLCLSHKGYKRPSMRKVTQMLAEALKMTPEAATSKVSPLLWAQLEILDDS